MTAALAGLLQRLRGPGLERAPGLLPALIAGVGVRLDSPLQIVRQALKPLPPPVQNIVLYLAVPCNPPAQG